MRTDYPTPRRAGAGLLHVFLIACSIVPHAFILSEASEWYGNADSSLWRPDGGKWRLRNDRWQPPWQKKNTAPRGSQPITQDPGRDHVAQTSAGGAAPARGDARKETHSGSAGPVHGRSKASASGSGSSSSVVQLAAHLPGHQFKVENQQPASSSTWSSTSKSASTAARARKSIHRPPKRVQAAPRRPESPAHARRRNPPAPPPGSPTVDEAALAVAREQRRPVPFRVVHNATAAQNQNCAGTGMNSPGGVIYDMAAVAAAGLVPYAWWDSSVRGPLQQLADSYVANFPRYERPSGNAPEQSPSGAASSGGQSPAGVASGGEVGVDSTTNWERAAGATVRQFPRGGDVATLRLENMLFSGSEEYSIGPGSSGSEVAVGGAPDVVVKVPAAMDTEEGRDVEAAGEAPLSIPSTPDQTGSYSAWGRAEPAHAQDLPANQAQPGQEACFAPVQQGNPLLWGGAAPQHQPPYMVVSGNHFLGVGFAQNAAGQGQLMQPLPMSTAPASLPTPTYCDPSAAATQVAPPLPADSSFASACAVEQPPRQQNSAGALIRLPNDTLIEPLPNPFADVQLESTVARQDESRECEATTTERTGSVQLGSRTPSRSPMVSEAPPAPEEPVAPASAPVLPSHLLKETYLQHLVAKAVWGASQRNGNPWRKVFGSLTAAQKIAAGRHVVALRTLDRLDSTEEQETRIAASHAMQHAVTVYRGALHYARTVGGDPDSDRSWQVGELSGQEIRGLLDRLAGGQQAYDEMVRRHQAVMAQKPQEVRGQEEPKQRVEGTDEADGKEDVEGDTSSRGYERRSDNENDGEPVRDAEMEVAQENEDKASNDRDPAASAVRHEKSAEAGSRQEGMIAKFREFFDDDEIREIGRPYTGTIYRVRGEMDLEQSEAAGDTVSPVQPAVAGITDPSTNSTVVVPAGNYPSFAKASVDSQERGKFSHQRLQEVGRLAVESASTVRRDEPTSESDAASSAGPSGRIAARISTEASRRAQRRAVQLLQQEANNEQGREQRTDFPPFAGGSASTGSGTGSGAPGGSLLRRERERRERAASSSTGASADSPETETAAPLIMTTTSASTTASAVPMPPRSPPSISSGAPVPVVKTERSVVQDQECTAGLPDEFDVRPFEGGHAGGARPTIVGAGASTSSTSAASWAPLASSPSWGSAPELELGPRGSPRKEYGLAWRPQLFRDPVRGTHAYRDSPSGAASDQFQ